MKKLIFIARTLCVCLCISALILMAGIGNLDRISKMDLVSYTACGIIAIASFVSFKLLGKIERQKEVLKHIDTDFLSKK